MSINTDTDFADSTLPAASALQNSSVCTPDPTIIAPTPDWAAPPSTRNHVDATPDKLSSADNETNTSDDDQPGITSAAVTGAVRSIRTDDDNACRRFPATSDTSAAAFKPTPSPEITESAGHTPSTPDSASEHDHTIVTSPENQPAAFGDSAGSPDNNGDVTSTLTGTDDTDTEFPAASTTTPDTT